MTFVIAPVGSCRIWNPLNKGARRHGYTIDRTRYLGFTHTSAEALQQVRFSGGAIDIPTSEMRFLIHTDPTVLPTDGPRSARPDLAVIEISSAKHYELDGLQIQVNCMTREFGAFFADNGRKNAFLNTARKANQPDIDAFLDQHWSGTEAMRADSARLRNLRYSIVTEDSLRADVRALMAAFPATLFVSHVNALTPEGRTLHEREAFITLLTRVVEGEGGTLCNPTALMQEMGQEAAMPVDNNHFSEEFGERLVGDWMARVISPMMQAKAPGKAPAKAGRARKAAPKGKRAAKTA